MTRWATILFFGAPFVVAVLSLALGLTFAPNSAGVPVFASCLASLGSAAGGYLAGTTATIRALTAAAGAAFGFIAYWFSLMALGTLNYFTL